MNDKKKLFESVSPAKALFIMSLPTVASQLILLIYNIADTWFIGRTDNESMIGALNLGMTIYMILVSIANIFGVGGGSLMVRHNGEKRPEDAKKVATYSFFFSLVISAAFSVLVLVFLGPLLTVLGAKDMTLVYGRQYLFFTVVLGGIPTVLSMVMPQFLRNAGYSKEAGFGVAFGSALNIALDPLFMFVILPPGNEVIGAAVATMLSNIASFIYFIIMYKKVSKESALSLSLRPVKLEKTDLKSLYMVGIPAAVSIILYDIVTMMLNRLSVNYGDGVKPLAAMGIILKVERIPINICLGICLGMVPLIAYNYGARNFKRMEKIATLSVFITTVISTVCMLCFFFFATPVTRAFVKDAETVRLGAIILQGRSIALPFMIFGYFAVNYMNAINKGKVSFLLAIIRHVILLLPIILIMNYVWGLTGLIWSQVVADVLNMIVSLVFYLNVRKQLKNMLTE